MGRKKNNTSGTDVEVKQSTPLAQRLSTLITDTNELKEYLGCSIQAINQYKLGISRPSLENLCKIADFYGVSTDYLLGRTETSNPDPKIQEICEYTGLSEHAVSVLHTIKLNEQGHPGRTLYQRFHKSLKYYLIDVLNYLLVNRDFLCVLDKFLDFGLYLDCSQNPSVLPFDEMIEARDKLFEHGFVVLDPFHQQSYFRHNILSDFERVLEQFTCAFQGENTTLDDVLGNLVPLKLYSFDTDDEGGPENAINQGTD